MVDHSELIVDVDNPATWPDQLAELVDTMTDHVREVEGESPDLACSDLDVASFEGEIEDVLDGQLLRAYHATRLLPHEVEAIRSTGLQILNDDLVCQRLTDAYLQGFLTEAERDQLVAGRTVTQGRRDKVCLFLSQNELVNSPHGFARLLETWGGEGIYWAHADKGDALRPKLLSLGTPSIVVALLDLAAPRQKTLIFPGLAHAFTSARLGLPDVGGSISYFAPITADKVEDIFQPGHIDYPSSAGIPQE